MKITKYEHACLDIEEQGKRLIIDPGVFSKSLTDLNNIYAVVVTHVHPDHFNPDVIGKILSANPEAMVYTVEAVSQELSGHPHITVRAGMREQCGPFHMAFFGGEHATIHESMPKQQNVGVLVNNLLYYPGDSFVKPDTEVNTLAVPSSAPWLKISEAMDFITLVKPKMVFPTHDALLSNVGAQIQNNHLGNAATSIEAVFKPLATGEFIEVDD